MRTELRLRHKTLQTERSYVGWVRRFVLHCQSDQLHRFGEKEVTAFLTELAVQGNVTPSTQNQAKCALLFLYQTVLQRELAFLDVSPAKKPERLPVVLSRNEIASLLPEFCGLKKMMFLTMYGTGVRHRECLRLRVKDSRFRSRLHCCPLRQR